MPYPVPRNFKSNPEINAKYLSVRKSYEPLLKSKVRVASAGGLLEYDDLLQEERVAMLYAVATHDPEKGSLLTWIGWIADNVIRVFLAHALTQGRMPRVWEWDGQAWEQRKVRPTSLDVTTDYTVAVDRKVGENGGSLHMPSALIDWADAESLAIASDDYENMRQLKLKFIGLMHFFLKNEPFALKLFDSRRMPEDGLLQFVRNKIGRFPEKPSDIKITHVASFHGVDRKATHKANDVIIRTAQEVMRHFTLEQIDFLMPSEIEIWLEAGS